MVDAISEVAVPAKEAEISAVEAKGDVFVVETHHVEVQTRVGATVIHQPDIQKAEQGHSKPITVTLGAVLGHDPGQADAGLSQSTGKQTPKPDDDLWCNIWLLIIHPFYFGIFKLQVTICISKR